MNLELDPQQNKGIKYYKKMLARNWMLFLISFIVFIGLGVLYLLIAPPQYLISSAVVVQAEPTPADPSSNFAGGVSSVLNANDNLKNEGDVLRTRYLLQETTNRLHLNVKMFSGSGLFSTEIFDEAPFTVKINHYRVDTLRRRDFKIQVINKYAIRVTNPDDNIDTTIQFNKALRTSQYNLIIDKKPYATVVPAVYSTRIVSEDDAVTDMIKGYDAEFSDKTTSTIDITFYYPNAKKGELIINHLNGSIHEG